MSNLQNQTRDLARAYSKEADARDEAFLKTADPRAVQGGQICEEANELRAVARKLNTIANEVVELFE